MMIGVQLYAFERKVIETELVSVLTELRAIGYDAVEGLPGHFQNYRIDLDNLKIRFAASHISPSALDDPAHLIKYLNSMGSTDVCSSGPISWKNRSYDDFCATCEFLNAKGRVLKNAGIFLHYHNHEFEFLPVRGETTGMDVLLQNLDLDVVDLCLDVGWAWRAGVDPSDFLHSHREHITYVHLRDFSRAGSVPLGEGEVNLSAVMESVRKLPALRWLVVEHNPVSSLPIKDLEVSRRFLRDKFCV